MFNLNDEMDIALVVALLIRFTTEVHLVPIRYAYGDIRWAEHP